MKIRLAIASLTFCGITQGQAPTWQWAHSGHCPGHDYGYSVSTDGDGNCYATGNFSGPSVIFGSDTLTSNSGFYLVKYDNQGNVIWARASDGSSTGTSISTDMNGNSYVTGYFSGGDTLKFDSVFIVASSTLNEVFVAKFDSTGNALWGKAAGSTAETTAYNGIDSDGNVYIVANFTVDSSLVKNFTKKYNSVGTLMWETSVSGNYLTPNICADSNGNSYVTGCFWGTSIIFGNDTVTNSSAGYIIYVVKYDNAGNVVWAISDGTYASLYVPSISTDGNGNSFLTGYFSGPFAQFGNILLTNASGNSDIFIVKYGNAGNALWAQRAGGADYDEGYSIKSDAAGNSYVTGVFKSLATFGTHTVFSAGVTDIFVAKYDSSGNALWVQKAGGINPDAGNGIAIDANGNSYVTGHYFSPAINFGTITEINSDTITNPAEIFIAKLNDIATKISEEKFDNYVKIFPNPFSTEATLYSDKSMMDATIIIYNSYGQKALEIKNVNGPSVLIHRTNLASGIYVAYIFDKNKNMSSRFMISDF